MVSIAWAKTRSQSGCSSKYEMADFIPRLRNVFSSSANNKYLVSALRSTIFRLFATPFSLAVVERNLKLVGTSNSTLPGFWIEIKMS